MCKFRIDKITYSKRSLEQRMTLVKISLYCILKKDYYKTKIDEIKKKIPNHDKYISTGEVIKLTTDDFLVRLKQAKSATKDDIASFFKKSYLDDKLTNIDKKLI